MLIVYHFEVNIRVRYSETDQMGFCYYGNYAQYFEVARVETLRSLGISYKDLEDSGIMLPVTKFNVEYYEPAKYDDLLTIKTSIVEMPNVKLAFNYETLNEAGKLLNKAFTELVFVNSEKKKPIRCPERLSSELKKHFNQ